MDDTGFLLNAHRELRRHNPEGQLPLVEGEATGKHVENWRYLVELDQEVRNQNGEVSIVGGGRSRYCPGRGDAAGL